MKAIVLLLSLVLSACGAGQREDTLRATYLSVTAAQAGFTTWDAEHQGFIVEQATSLEQGKEELRVYRQNREEILLAFSAAYHAIALAAMDEDTPLLEMLAAAQALYDAIAALEALRAK